MNSIKKNSNLHPATITPPPPSHPVLLPGGNCYQFLIYSPRASQALAQQIFSMKNQVAGHRFGFAGMWPWSHCLTSAVITQNQPQTWCMWTYQTRFQYSFTDGHTNVNFTLFSWVTQCGFSFGIFLNHLKMCKPWDFPGSPVVKTLHFHCWEPRFDPWSGK